MSDEWESFLERVCASGGTKTFSASALGSRYPHPNHASLPVGVVPSSEDDGNRLGHPRKHLFVDSRLAEAGGASFRAVVLCFRVVTGEVFQSPPRDWSTEDGWRADLAALARHGVDFNSSSLQEMAWARVARATRRPVLEIQTQPSPLGGAS